MMRVYQSSSQRSRAGGNGFLQRACLSTFLIIGACGDGAAGTGQTALALLRSGASQICASDEVRDQLRQSIIGVPATDIVAGHDNGSASGASQSFEATTLLAFDRAVGRADCSTTIRIRSRDGGQRAFPLRYSITPASDDDGSIVVNADVAASATYAKTVAGVQPVATASDKVAPPPSQVRADSDGITSAWLVGVWASRDVRVDGSACDTENVVEFMRDGSYEDGGSRGRFRTDGRTITYYNRILFDMAAETEDRSQFDTPLVTRVTRRTDRSLTEDGDPLFRCDLE